MRDVTHFEGGDDPETVGPCTAFVFVIERKGVKGAKARIMRQADFENGVAARAWGKEQEATLKGAMGLSGTIYFDTDNLPSRLEVERRIVAMFKDASR